VAAPAAAAGRRAGLTAARRLAVRDAPADVTRYPREQQAIVGRLTREAGITLD
jgi:hypothetical protein